MPGKKIERNFAKTKQMALNEQIVLHFYYKNYYNANKDEFLLNNYLKLTQSENFQNPVGLDFAQEGNRLRFLN